MTVNIYIPSELDGFEAEERKLYDLTNEYRAENGLSPIPASKALTLVANRHVLDLTENIGSLTHAWSDAPYDGSNPDTWPSMWTAPQRFNTGYPGNGYENAHGGAGGYIATAENALNGWKNSSAHNAVILNQGIWDDRDWNALGVGIYEGYAVLWFGEEADPTGTPAQELSSPVVPEPPVLEPPVVVPPVSPGTPVPPVPVPPVPVPPVPVANSQGAAVYRFFNTLTGTHFYTASQGERDHVRDNVPLFNYEGPTFAAASGSALGTSAVYRFFNTQTGTHFYTISDVEAAYVRDNLTQFNDEGVAYQAYQAPAAGTIPLYRFFNGTTGTHFYTPSEVERDHIIDNLFDFNYEGIGYYVNNLNNFNNPNDTPTDPITGEPSFAERAVELTNAYRVQNGLPPLTVDPQLTTAAQAHSQDMALNDFFSHRSLDGSGVSDRAVAAGYPSSFVGENIGVGYANPEAALAGWLDSPGHRANILNNDYTSIGVGYYFLENDTGVENWNHYWTQVFGG